MPSVSWKYLVLLWSNILLQGVLIIQHKQEGNLPGMFLWNNFKTGWSLHTLFPDESFKSCFLIQVILINSISVFHIWFITFSKSVQPSLGNTKRYVMPCFCELLATGITLISFTYVFTLMSSIVFKYVIPSLTWYLIRGNHRSFKKQNRIQNR